MPVLSTVKSDVPVKLWAKLEEVESDALQQLKNMGRLPFVFKHIAAMPDVHLGKGATVGSVFATQGAVCPAAVGVDIGCGMCAVRLEGVKAEHLEGKLTLLLSEIEAAIPTGFNANQELGADARDWKGWAAFKDLHASVQDRRDKAMHQLGSLGGGNHFIEICLDTQGRVWLMLHSGSRNIGKELAEVYIHDAKSELKKRMIRLPDPELAYFQDGTPGFKAYMHDLLWAQDYARQNREIMMNRLYETVCGVLGSRPRRVDAVNCHHNFVAEEKHYGEKVLVTRKGAVRARKEDMGIIPGSMGTKSYIVRGKGNPEAFESCSHGAGRRMSRTRAKKDFTVSDLRRQTEGVVCRKEPGLVDEIPAAYKDIDQVMRNQEDLVEVAAELKQVLCVKGF
jgi:tRNA-splicing ligase RtcB (3'-phosphate/5'-hydroxy nucleic acid ligase)